MTYPRRLAVSLLTLSIVALSLVAKSAAQTGVAEPLEEQSVRPDVNANFLDPDLDPNQWVNRFEVESREVYRSRDSILEAMELKQGDRIADVGAGTGLFTALFAEKVGSRGWIFAVDIAPKFIERIGALAEEKKLFNVSPVLGAERYVRLPPECVDVVFVCDTYHHFEYPQTTLASIRRALRPGGRLVVVDYERIPGVSREWTLGHVRAGKEEVRQEIQAARFKFVGEKEIAGLEENYFIVFEK